MCKNNSKLSTSNAYGLIKLFFRQSYENERAGAATHIIRVEFLPSLKGKELQKNIKEMDLYKFPTVLLFQGPGSKIHL